MALAPDGYVLVGPLGEGVVQEASFLTRLDDDGNRSDDFAAPTLGGGLRLTDVAVRDGIVFAVGESLGNVALYRTDLAGNDGVRFVDPALLSSLRAVFWSPADNDFILGGNCDPNACFARFNESRMPPDLSPNRITAVTSGSASVVDAVADAQGRYFAITTGWSLVRFVPEPLRPAGVDAFSVLVDELGAEGISPQGIQRTDSHLYVAATLPDPSAETGIPTVVRYSSTWTRDAGFASGGVSRIDGSVEVGSSVDVAVQSDGRIVVATVEAGQLAIYRIWD